MKRLAIALLLSSLSVTTWADENLYKVPAGTQCVQNANDDFLVCFHNNTGERLDTPYQAIQFTKLLDNKILSQNEYSPFEDQGYADSSLSIGDFAPNVSTLTFSLLRNGQSIPGCSVSFKVSDGRMEKVVKHIIKDKETNQLSCE